MKMRNMHPILCSACDGFGRNSTPPKTTRRTHAFPILSLMTAHRANSVAGVQYRIRLPTTVSEVIAVGATGCVGRLRSHPTRVLKFCIKERTDAVQQLEQEKKMYAIIDHYPLISRRSAMQVFVSNITRLDGLEIITSPVLPTWTIGFGGVDRAVSAFKFFYSKDIVHGDISPRNILLSETKDLKICDRRIGFRNPHGLQTLCRFTRSRT